MKVTTYILFVFLFACKPDKPSAFKSLKGKADVEIFLSEYNLKAVPKDIGDLNGVERLYISKDTGGWTIYPPLSALDGSNKESSPGRLPDEITKLTSLKSLTLVNLDLVTLPEKIERLEKLDTLILYANRLTIENEVNKLEKLKHLKYLGLLGNNVTANDLIEIKKAIPNIVINPQLR